jgi:hypothetical protein
MDIIDMAVVVFLVFDQMCPKAALPQTAFTAFLAAFGNTLAIHYVSRFTYRKVLPNSSILSTNKALFLRSARLTVKNQVALGI